MDFLTRLPFVATIVTFVCVVIMFALGVWQLQRAEEKNVRLLAIEQAAKTDHIDLAQALSRNLDSMLDMPITFEGEGDSIRYFLLDNKIHKGRVGYQVLVPMHTQLGVVMANFGWVAATNSRNVLPEIKIDPQKAFYSGVISVPNNNVMVTETAKVDDIWPKVLQQADLNVMQLHYKQPLLPVVVLLADQPISAYVRDWQPVVMPPEKHIAYAAQWFLLAFAALAVFIFAHKNKLTRK